jgi:hypothetical protein
MHKSDRDMTKDHYPKAYLYMRIVHSKLFIDKYFASPINFIIKMNSIFDKLNYEKLVNRLNKLNRSSTPTWGKMNIDEMLHHLNLTMEAPLGKIKTKGSPNFFMKIFKSVLYNDKVFGKGNPTPKDFKVQGNYEFDGEKEKCISNMKEIFNRGVRGDYQPHVFFGTITSEQWGKHFYKHIDHHLRQFGV